MTVELQLNKSKLILALWIITLCSPVIFQFLNLEAGNFWFIIAISGVTLISLVVWFFPQKDSEKVLFLQKEIKTLSDRISTLEKNTIPSNNRFLPKPPNTLINNPLWDELLDEIEQDRREIDTEIEAENLFQSQSQNPE
jgi:hypothetical protein